MAPLADKSFPGKLFFEDCMSKKPARRPYRGVPIVEIDGQQVTMRTSGDGGVLKRHPLPDGSYYIVYKETKRVEGRLKELTRFKSFGTDPTWAIYRFVCWREGLKRRYRRIFPRRRWPSGATKTRPKCDGKGTL